jgi:outer membrane lipoprotein-sorting protein
MKFAFRILILLLLPMLTSAQDAMQTINELTAKMNRINDYSVNAVIRSDIPFIKILPIKATIYFKQKDKFRIKSKSIAILPKQGFTDLSTLLNNKGSYTAVANGSEIYSNTNAAMIIILPVSDTSDLTMARLWIDTENDIILKSQITTRSSGTIMIEYTYGAQKQIGLPDNVVITVDVKKFKIPKGVATDINRNSETDEKKPPGKTGKVFIKFTDYMINKGISDDIFTK